MKKKLWLFVIFVLLFQVVVIPFSYVEAGDEKQPKVCNGPSEMMSYYFAFQLEMNKVLQGTQLNSERFSAEFGPGGLFTNRVLELHTTSAIELLSSSVVGNLRSFVSNSITSMFLLELAAFSVLQSNTEGFAMLFADWPIVRDYKKMLDIETQLFDVAYFRSMEVDLTRKIDSSSEEKIKNVIKEYKDLGLLDGSDAAINGSIGDILLDLIQMNAAMKQFIMVGGKNIGKAGLQNYNGCFGNHEKDVCDGEVAIIKFNDKAINSLYEDYKGVRGLFGGCNLNGNHIKSVLKKTINNNSDSVSQAMQDVEDAIGRLNEALFKKKRGNSEDPCENLSDYEMAQLQAYWGGDWECGEGISLYSIKKYLKEKKVHSEQKKKGSQTLKKSKSSKKGGNLNDDIKTSWNSSEREQKYKSTIGTGNLSRYYNFDLADGFLGVSEMTINEYFQAQESAVSTDIALFPQVRELLNQVDKTNDTAANLNLILKHLQGKQCSRKNAQ